MVKNEDLDLDLLIKCVYLKSHRYRVFTEEETACTYLESNMD